ncbi:MAG: hypothetical protein ACTSRW_08435 [Candidatus Helarchaeota archaeon]
MPTIKIISTETSVSIPKDKQVSPSDPVYDSFLENLQRRPKKRKSSKELLFSESEAKPVEPISPPSTIDSIEDDDFEEGETGEGGMSEELLKTMKMLEEIKQENLASESSTTLKEDIPLEIDESILKKITCPFCQRSIPLRKLEFLQQGYSDYCPYCHEMILPDQVADQL